MSARTSLAIRLPAISAADRVTRQREIDFARGNVRHEGGMLSDEIKRLNASYIAGEIDSDALTAAILRSDTVQPQRLARSGRTWRDHSLSSV